MATVRVRHQVGEMMSSINGKLSRQFGPNNAKQRLCISLVRFENGNGVSAEKGDVLDPNAYLRMGRIYVWVMVVCQRI